MLVGCQRQRQCLRASAIIVISLLRVSGDWTLPASRSVTPRTDTALCLQGASLHPGPFSHSLSSLWSLDTPSLLISPIHQTGNVIVPPSHKPSHPLLFTSLRGRKRTDSPSHHPSILITCCICEAAFVRHPSTIRSSIPHQRIRANDPSPLTASE